MEVAGAIEEQRPPLAYRLQSTEVFVPAGIRRIACEQLDKALAPIVTQDAEGAIHDVRTRCKKLLGLLRIVQPNLSEFRSESHAFRDIAGHLSDLREAKVLQDTYDRLLERRHNGIDRRALGQIRRRFTLEHTELRSRVDLAARFAECREDLAAARDRAGEWTIARDGWSAVGPGLTRTYTRARSAARNAREEGTAEAWHELRKQLKYHYFHTLLLRRIWPREMRVRAGVAARATDLLGQHHDLAVFKSRLIDDRFSGDLVIAELALGLATKGQQVLLSQAGPLIGRLLAEKPRPLARNWRALWENSFNQ